MARKLGDLRLATWQAAPAEFRVVQPLSAFRANAAGFLDQVRSTKRPLVLTQHGKSAAVVLDVDEYEALVDEIEVIRDIRQAKEELARGEGIPHDEVVAELRARLSR